MAEAAAAALDAGAESLERQAEGVAAALGAELATGCARCATVTQSLSCERCSILQTAQLLGI